MAKLVEIWRADTPLHLTKRQMPLVIDENLTMIMDVRGLGVICDSPPIRGKQLDEFSRNFDTLTNEEARSSFQATCKDLMDVLGKYVPCVGCRRSVEKLFNDLKQAGHPVLDPLLFTPDGLLTVREEFLKSRQLLGTILHNHSSRLNSIVEKQTRSKKSHRCALHSLEVQRMRPPPSAWREVWECMGPKCKQEITLINSDVLETTLETYLTKHRFCSECRTKVLLASSLLTSESDPTKEKGYVASLYDGIRRCPLSNHVHLPTNTEYINAIISRAQPEIIGRERHAKTLEIAQEEVVTCLGICVVDRLHRMHRRLKEAEMICKVLAAVAVEALAKKFEVAVDTKQGVRKLNLLCEELKSKELAEQLRQEKLKLKRKKKKKERRTEAEEKENIYNCSSERCSSNSQDSSPCLELKPIAENIDRNKLQVLDPKNKGSLTCRCDDCLKRTTSIEMTQVPQISKKSIPEVKKSGQKDDSPRKDSSKNKKANKGEARKTSSKDTSELNQAKNLEAIEIPLPKSSNGVEKDIDDKLQGYENHKWNLHTFNENFTDLWLKRQHEWTNLLKEDISKWTERASRSPSEYSSRDRGYSSEHYSSSGSFSSTPEGSDVAWNDTSCINPKNSNTIQDFSNSRNIFNDSKPTLVSMVEMFQNNPEDEGTEDYIPKEVIRQFKAQKAEIDKQREQIRQQMHDEFNKLKEQGLKEPIRPR